MSKKRIGYAKLGRSMPLDYAKCGPFGGDVEMIPTVKLLAERHHNHEFWLLGRNTGENPTDVGLPRNVINPWIEWAPELRRLINKYGLNHGNLTVPEHIQLRNIIESLTNDVFTELSGMVMWLGQHGTTNTPLPKISDPSVLTKPYDWSTLYASYLLSGINRWRDEDPYLREEVLLNADPRNYVKYRDAKWPWRHPVLGQFNHTNRVKHHRYGDSGMPGPEHPWADYPVNDTTWTSTLHNVYSRLEVNCLIPGTPFVESFTFNDDWNREHNFGIVINETRRQGRVTRLDCMREWVLPARPGFIHGKWANDALVEFRQGWGYSIRPVAVQEYFRKIQSTRCTITTPPSGSGWATAKPWESFAAGVVCFFHPAYDTQDHILGDADPELRDWLRPATREEFWRRVDHLGTEAGKSDFYRILYLQLKHVSAAVDSLDYMTLVENRLFGGKA